jgi:hypothetical protein
MKITFQDKAQSNEAQEKAYLQLSPIERIYSFINLNYQLKDFPSKAEIEKKDNFIINIKSN